MPSLTFSRLRSVLADKGPNPEYHHLIEQRHRQEWPLLWAAIDELCEMDDAVPDRGDGYYDAFGKFHAGPKPRILQHFSPTGHSNGNGEHR
jgi:hypothetical protein